MGEKAESFVVSSKDTGEDGKKLSQKEKFLGPKPGGLRGGDVAAGPAGFRNKG